MIPLNLEVQGVPEFSEAPRPDPTNNPMEIELRGYELGRLVITKAGRRWEQVIKYRPTTYGWSQAVKDGRFLQRRHPEERYSVRPIVSMNPPDPVETGLPDTATTAPALPSRGEDADEPTALAYTPGWDDVPGEVTS